MIRRTFRKPRKRKRVARMQPAEATALGTRGKRWRGNGWPYTRVVSRKHKQERRRDYQWRFRTQ